MRSWVVTQVNSVSEKVSAHRLGGIHFFRISGEIGGPIFGQFLAKIWSSKFLEKNSLPRARVHLRLRARARVYACVCTCVYACVCMCVYACVCMCVHMCVCMYVCICMMCAQHDLEPWKLA